MCSIGIESFDFTNFSTGRFIPENLYEKLALEAAKSNPLAGKVIVPVLNDPRLPVGMSKFSQVFSTSLGKIEIHYVGNATLNIFFDWKFKP